MNGMQSLRKMCINKCITSDASIRKPVLAAEEENGSNEKGEAMPNRLHKTGMESIGAIELQGTANRHGWKRSSVENVLSNVVLSDVQATIE
jgi:hypothetical protein